MPPGPRPPDTPQPLTGFDYLIGGTLLSALVFLGYTHIKHQRAPTLQLEGTVVNEPKCRDGVLHYQVDPVMSEGTYQVEHTIRHGNADKSLHERCLSALPSVRIGDSVIVNYKEFNLEDSVIKVTYENMKVVSHAPSMK